MTSADISTFFSIKPIRTAALIIISSGVAEKAGRGVFSITFQTTGQPPARLKEEIILGQLNSYGMLL